MNGRLENEYKIDSIIQDKLQNTPSFVYDWMNWLEASGLTASTRLEYLNKVLHFLQTINVLTNKISINQITDQDFIRYFIKIKTKDTNGIIEETSDSYRQEVYCALKNFCNYLENYKLSDHNYLKNIQKPKTKIRVNEKKEYLTEEDFRQILYYARLEPDFVLRARDVCILSIFMTTGMRKSALQSINVDDIDFDTNTLTVIDKEEATQVYTLGEQTIMAIKNWLAMRKRYVNYDNLTSALFLSYQGNRMCNNSISKVVKKYSEQALGRKISPHKLRAGYCSILYDQKGDIEFVRRAVGHARVTTTQRYIRTDNTERDEAANIFDSIL